MQFLVCKFLCLYLIHAASWQLSIKKVVWKRLCGETAQKWLRVLNDFTIGMVCLGMVHAVSVTSAALREWHSAKSVSACELSSVQHRAEPRMWSLWRCCTPEQEQLPWNRLHMSERKVLQSLALLNSLLLYNIQIWEPILFYLKLVDSGILPFYFFTKRWIQSHFPHFLDSKKQMTMNHLISECL